MCEKKLRLAPWGRRRLTSLESFHGAAPATSVVGCPSDWVITSHHHHYLLITWATPIPFLFEAFPATRSDAKEEPKDNEHAGLAATAHEKKSGSRPCSRNYGAQDELGERVVTPRPAR
jgi:hypothetical protein